MTVEDDRIDALKSLEILDTPPEAEFDSLVQVAAAACGTPLAFLTLLDGARLWCKATAGYRGPLEMPQAESFCRVTVAGEHVVEVPDATLDPRFSELRVVRTAPHMRFYAGAPIRLGSGHQVGAVCVHDTVPRQLEPAQREVLRCLALAAARSLESRRALIGQHRLERSLEAARLELAAREQIRRNYEATPAMLHSINADGQIQMVSDRWLSKLGYARSEVIGRLSTDFMTETSRRMAMMTELPRFFRGGRCENIAYQMVAKDGSIIDVTMSASLEHGETGSPYSLTVVEDVTDRLRAERALREGETNYRGLAEATSDVITQIDLGMVRRYVSPASRMVLGYEPEEMIGRDPRENVHPKDVEGFLIAFEALMAGTMPGDRTMVTFRNRHRDGHWIWVEAGLNLVRDPASGAPRHMICALRDVSERRRIAEELEAARAAAEHAVLSKTEFLANMSHELRTPLTGLLGVHALLATEPDLAPRHRRHLALAQEAGHSLMTVINEVLDYSKIEAGRLTIESVPFDLHALVEACRDVMRQEAIRKGLEFEITAPAGLYLLGDPMRLRQVLLNFAANAVKFTTRGRIGIEAVYDPLAARLRLSVSDTGIGISADQMDVVFQRFHQAEGSTTRQFGGTGLGLTICKHLIETMGGTITASSTPRVGSVFTVEIPATVAAEVVVPTALESIDRAVEPRRVLLAEDNSLNRMIIREMLTRAGHHVIAVENGAEVVALMDEFEAFDVVLMDVQTPVLDGIAATRLIREREDPQGRRMLIIGLTANATVEDRRDCIAAGMDGHVAKPIDWPELYATLDRLDGERMAQTRVRPDAFAPAVLDQAGLATLANIIGPVRLEIMLRKFMGELQDRLIDLADLSEEELLGCAHGWISMAGHFGFSELQRHAADLHADAKAGRGRARVSDLLAAAERALRAAENCRFIPAA